MRNIAFLYPILILCHLPLSSITGIDQSCMMIYLLDVITFLLLLSDKLFRNVVSEKISILWFILILYHAINSYFHQVPYTAGYLMMFMRMFDVYFLMLLSAYCYIVDRKKFITIITFGFLLFLFITLFITKTGGEQRLEGSINATQIGQTAGCAMMVIVLSKYIKNLSVFKISILSILPILTTLLAGSRNGLLLIVIAILALIVANSMTNLTFGNALILLVSLVILYFLIDYVLNNTVVGQRMASTTDQAEEYGLETGTFLDFFGDRGVYYYYGYELFRANPIFGIGLWNFRYVSPLPFPLHSEYMVHLCEGGLVGATLYLSIILRFINKSFKIYSRNRDKISLMMIFFVISYLFVGLSARLLFTPHFPVMLGIVMASIMVNSYKHNNIVKNYI